MKVLVLLTILVALTSCATGKNDELNKDYNKKAKKVRLK